MKLLCIVLAVLLSGCQAMRERDARIYAVTDRHIGATS